MRYFYFSNNIAIAKGLDHIDAIDTIFIDLEIIGKEKRQAGTNSLISGHSFEDITKVKKVIKETYLGVRINPIYSNSRSEIEECIQRGADILMLPMFKNVAEVDKCLEYINGRCKLDLLFETPESLLKISEFPFEKIRYAHFGINDLSLALNYRNMFDCFFSNVLNDPIQFLNSRNIIFGIGGVGASDARPISPKIIFGMHSFYNSTRVILSRNFLRKIDLSSKINTKESALSEFKKLKDAQVSEFLNKKSYQLLKDEYEKLII